ncbi:hypothetical protein ACFL0L_03540 [Patescibacteria group bacterium]
MRASETISEITGSKRTGNSAMYVSIESGKNKIREVRKERGIAEIGVTPILLEKNVRRIRKPGKRKYAVKRRNIFSVM